MADPRPKTGEPHVDGDFDRELNYRAIIIFVLAIAFLTIGTFVFAWYFNGGLKSNLIAGDPETSPLVEARTPRIPPKPHLQTLPYEDLITMRAVEDSVLSSYAVVDQDGAKVRIPISEAMRRIADNGLPQWTATDPAANH
jgi:hypothetical protein